MKKFIFNLIYFLLLVVFTFLLMSCGTTKITKEVETRVVIDTIIVEIPGREDTIKEVTVGTFSEIGLVFTGAVVDSGEGGIDTVVVVRFLQQDTTFIIEVFPDTIIIEKVRVDTVSIIHNIEEPTIIEQWWWLIPLIIGGIILIIILRRIKK